MITVFRCLEPCREEEALSLILEKPEEAELGPVSVLMGRLWLSIRQTVTVSGAVEWNLPPWPHRCATVQAQPADHLLGGF